MTLICFEGASGVGKTTTCKGLEQRYNAYIVPEVNFLFDRPNPESKRWYLEKQVERWQIAQEKLISHNLVLFDGDPFQPLWYNWIYQNEYPDSLPFLKEYYLNQIQKGNIVFPDLYIHLYK